MRKRAILVAVANGAEEIETVTIVDVLRRAGATVTLAKAGSIGSDLKCQMSRGMSITADALLRDEAVLQTKYDAIVLPGGLEGAKTLAKEKLLLGKIALQMKEHRLVAAICAAPVFVLANNNLLNNVPKAVCHPTVIDNIENEAIRNKFLRSPKEHE